MKTAGNNYRMARRNLERELDKSQLEYELSMLEDDLDNNPQMTIYPCIICDKTFTSTKDWFTHCNSHQ